MKKMKNLRKKTLVLVIGVIVAAVLIMTRQRKKVHPTTIKVLPIIPAVQSQVSVQRNMTHWMDEMGE